MSKLNKSTAAKVARHVKQSTSGTIIDGRYISHYDQGRNAYISRQQYRDLAHRAWQEGWRAERDNDMKLLVGAQSQSYKDSITARMMECMDIKLLKVA